MKNVGISSACLYPDEVLSSVEKIASLGVPVMEVFFNSYYESDKENLKNIKRAADASGTKIISYHPFTSIMEGLLFFSGYAKRVHDGLELYKHFFESAAILGADYFVFHGEKSSPTFSRSVMDNDALLEVYEKLALAARDEGVLFTQENVSSFRSQNPSFLRHLRENLGEKIGFTFDVKQVLRAGQDLYETLDAMGERLVHIHINDYSRKTECRLPFCGEVDLVKLADELKQKGYRGDYVLEVYRNDFDQFEELTDSCHKVKELFCPN